MERRSLAARIARWITTAILSVALGSIAIVAVFRWVPVPVTSFMINERLADAGSPPLRQRHDWVTWTRISRHAAIAVIASEDQKFLRHDGFDFDAIGKAVTEAQRGRRLRGASTISQQVAKNLFLWPGQSWVRKGLEVWFTVWIEFLWPKQRILEVYLNCAQFGRGIWGVEAAAWRYFGIPASALSVEQSALLAAAIINPRVYSPARPNGRLLRRQQIILSRMAASGG